MHHHSLNAERTWILAIRHSAESMALQSSTLYFECIRAASRQCATRMPFSRCQKGQLRSACPFAPDDRHWIVLKSLQASWLPCRSCLQPASDFAAEQCAAAEFYNCNLPFADRVSATSRRLGYLSSCDGSNFGSTCTGGSPLQFQWLRHVGAPPFCRKDLTVLQPCQTAPQLYQSACTLLQKVAAHAAVLAFSGAWALPFETHQPWYLFLHKPWLDLG
jgi:hypothetical protein